MRKTAVFLLATGLASSALAQGWPDIINYVGGHQSGIEAVAFSSDGSRLATTQIGGPINIFEAGTGSLLIAIRGSGRQVSFSPDGQRLIAGDESGFTVFNAATGATVRRVGLENPFSQTLWAGAITQDGSRAAGLVSNGTAILWDLETGTAEEFPVLGVIPTSAAFSADGSSLSIGTTGGHIRSFSTQDGSLLGDFVAHSGSIFSLSYKGTTIVSGGQDRLVKTWNSETEGLIRQMSGHGSSVYVARMSPDGQRLISGAGGSQLFLWNANTGGIICAFWNHQGTVKAADFDPEGETVVGGDTGINVNHWQLNGLVLLRNFSNHKGEIDEVAISPDGKTVASASWDGNVKLWRGENLFRTIPFGMQVYTTAFSPDSTKIVVGGGIITRVYDVATGAQLGMTAHGGVSMGATFARDSQSVYSTCTGGEVKRIGINGSQQWLTHLQAPVIYVAVPHSGNIVAAATINSNQTQVWTVVHILDASSGNELRSWTAHMDYIRGLTFAPDGKLITGFFDGTKRAWNPNTGAQLWSRSGPGGVNALDLNATGDVIMTGESQSIRFFRTSDGAQLKHYDDGLPNAINSIEFSADERWYVYGLDTGSFATAKSPFAVDVESATLVRGTTASGGMSSLAERDENYWRIKPGIVFSSGQAPIQLVIEGTAPASTASRLTFGVVAGASASALSQEIELFDFQANAWQVVDTRMSSTGDQVVTFQETNASRFVQAGTRAVRARISWKQVAPLLVYPWQVRIDQAYWVITP